MLAALTSQEPLEGPAVALLLHGYGASSDDLAGLAPITVPGLPWASREAPIALGPGSSAWFEIVLPGDPAPEPVAAATDAIWEWVDSHVGPATRLVPIGFSQGGLMASELLRTRPKRVAATVILAGFVQGAERPADSLLSATLPRVFWGRGREDRVITAAAVARTESWLPEHSTLTREVYAGLGHGISPEEAGDVATFVKASLSDLLTDQVM
jgi:phospholipase/carboxylesterase